MTTNNDIWRAIVESNHREKIAMAFKILMRAEHPVDRQEAFDILGKMSAAELSGVARAARAFAGVAEEIAGGATP